MESISSPEVYGIGAVAIILTSIFTTLIWKLLQSHERNVLTVLRDVHETNKQLVNNVRENTEVTKQNTAASKDTKDYLSQILLEVIKSSKRK